MASTEIEIIDSAAIVESEVSLEQVKQVASGRALNRRNFMAALGVAGAASGAAFLATRGNSRPGLVEAAIAPTQTDVLNFALNLEYLEATFYSYVTQGTDLPASITVGSGAITNPPAAKITFTGPNAAQITDLLNEIYYDELSHVLNLRSVLGAVAVNRPAINLAAYSAITATNALSLARLFEDVGVTAYAGAAAALTGTNLTYAAQILAVEGFHSGALRLVSIQNPTIAADYPTGVSGVTFTGTTASGSAVVSAIYFLSATALTVGQVVTGPGISGNPTIVAITTPGTGTNLNTATTGTFASGATAVTAVPSTAAGLAVGQIITGTGIPAATTITAIVTVGTGSTATFTLTLSAKTTAAGTNAALIVGTASITLSGNASATAANQTYLVGSTDTADVAPYDPGTAALSAAGPTAKGGFFATSGSSTANSFTPTGTAFARSTSQVLAILFGAAGVSAATGAKAGGFFPSGLTGVITSV